MMIRSQRCRLSRVGRQLHLVPFFPRCAAGGALGSHAPTYETPLYLEHLHLNQHHRLFGSFQKKDNNNDENNWYRESLRTVVADLRQELELDPQDIVPVKPLDPIQSLRNVLQGRSTVSSVNHSFSLLDQLILEKNGGQSNLDFSQLNTASILNPLVLKWKDCWSRKNSSRASETVELLTPWSLIEKINSYEECFPGLLPNTETYNTILYVASQNYGNEDSHQIGLFVQSVVDKMETEALNEGSQRVYPDSETFQILIQTWARAGNLQEVQGIVKSLQETADVQMSPETLDIVAKATAAQLEAVSILHKELKLPPVPTFSNDVVATSSVISDPKEDLDLLRQWIDSKSTDGVSKAFQRLDDILLSKTFNGTVPTNLVSDLLLSWNKCWRNHTTKLQPAEVMEKVLAYHDEGNGFRLDTSTCNTLMKAITDDEERKRSHRLCKQLFDRMEQDFRNGDATAAPDHQTYNHCIILSAVAGDIQGALDLLVSLRNIPKKNQPDREIRISLICFRVILSKCLHVEQRQRAKGRNARPSRNLGFLAESILDLMVQLREAGRLESEEKNRRLMATIYKGAIRCWEASAHPESPRKISELLQRLDHTRKDRPNKDRLNTRKSNFKPYPQRNSLIDALAKQGDVEAAQSQLEQMCREFESGKLYMEPNTRSFNTVINAWAQEGAADKAERLLRIMFQLHESGKYTNVRPNAFSFNCCINAISKCSDSSQRGKRALSLLEESEHNASEDRDYSRQPTTMTYTSVINCLAKEGDAEGAESLLQRMHVEYDKGNWRLEPTTRTYNAVLRAWGLSCTSDAGVNAERLLKRMYELHQNGMKKMLPDFLTYNFVLQAWANSGNPRAGEETERIFNEMSNALTERKPDADAMGFLVCAWAKAGDVEKAEDWLLSLCERYMTRETTYVPNRRTFSYVFDGWNRNDGEQAGNRRDRLCDRMESLVHKMVNEYQGGPGTNNVKPDLLRCFNMLLVFYKRIEDPEAGPKADNALEWMGKLGIEPDRDSYRFAVWCWKECSNHLPNAQRRIESLDAKRLGSLSSVQSSRDAS